MKFAWIAWMLLVLPAVAQDRYTDSDWNVQAVVSCGLPEARSGTSPVDWVMVQGDRKLGFTLYPGQFGRCSTDTQARHRAPFWERAEFNLTHQITFDRPMRISFEATFVKGFTGNRETFFQIHGWNANCDAYPPLMLNVQKGRLEVQALTFPDSILKTFYVSPKGRHRPLTSKAIDITKHMGRPLKFDLTLRPQAPQKSHLTLKLNGQSISEGTVAYASCAVPYIKFGIYRPGGNTAVSKVLFDDITVTQ